MQYENGCDEIGLSSEWGHAVQAQQLEKEESNDESHMRAQVNYEVWADEDVDYEDDDKLVVQWTDDEEYYLELEKERLGGKEWEK